MCEQAVCDEGAHGGEGRVELMIGAEQKLRTYLLTVSLTYLLAYSLTYLLLTSTSLPVPRRSLRLLIA